MGVYLAADHPLPLIEWTEERPSFNVTELADDEAPVRGRFSKRHVYYLGSYTGCSCGFVPDEEGEEGEAERSLVEMIAYVAEAAGDGEVELFTCWDGDYLEPAARRLDLAAAELANPELWFDELVFATIRAPREPRVEPAADAAGPG